MERKHTKEDLKTMQAWSLQRKIQVTQTRIMEWYLHFDGQVYISFSGGKDSTVLLDLARRIYPDIEAVFVDTGLEYPEIRDFVKTFDNVRTVKPKRRFDEIITRFGYPLIGKETAGRIASAKNNIDCSRAKKLLGTYRLDGKKTRYSQKSKWAYLIDAPFKISDWCCEAIKKQPLKKIKKKPITGSMACESDLRETKWLESGCNAFDNKKQISQPMSFWTEQDVLQYLILTKIPFCKVYGEIVPENDQTQLFQDLIKLKTTGCKRTGCMFCLFGATNKDDRRLLEMKETHPQQYNYCLNGGEFGEDGLFKPNKNGLGYKYIIDNYIPEIKY